MTFEEWWKENGDHYLVVGGDYVDADLLDVAQAAWQAAQHELLCGPHLNTLAGFFSSGEEVEGPDGYSSVIADLEYWNEASEACDALIARIVPPETEDDV